MLLQGASLRGALPSRGGLGAGIIAASHMITKSAHARTPFVASVVAVPVIGSGIVAFGPPLPSVKLTPPCNVIILNNRGLGLRLWPCLRQVCCQLTPSPSHHRKDIAILRRLLNPSVCVVRTAILVAVAVFVPLLPRYL
jgi:hypothetical protein